MANTARPGDFAKMPYKPGTGSVKTLPYKPGSGVGAKTMPYYPTKQVAPTRKMVRPVNASDTRDVFEKALETNNPLRKALFPKPRGG